MRSIAASSIGPSSFPVTWRADNFGYKYGNAALAASARMSHGWLSEFAILISNSRGHTSCPSSSANFSITSAARRFMYLAISPR